MSMSCEARERQDLLFLTQLTSKMAAFMLEMNQFVINALFVDSRNYGDGRSQDQQSSSSEHLQVEAKPNEIKIKPPKKKPKEKEELQNSKPKGPTSSFLIYYHQNKYDLAKKFGEINVSKLTKLASQEWKNLQASERQQYQQKSYQSKLRYQKQMQIYKEKNAQQLKEETRRKRLEYRLKWMNKKKAKEMKQKDELLQDINSELKLSQDDNHQIDSEFQSHFILK